MDTFLDMQTELTSRLSAVGSTFYTSTRIKSALNQGKDRAEGFALWPSLESAEVTSTENNLENYDYPERFRSDSIVRLMIDGKKYDPKDYDDFLDYTRRTSPPPDRNTRIFADHNRQYFVWPLPQVDGNANIQVWGIAGTGPMVANDDRTIFSRSDVTGNEAIVKFALGILLAKGKNKSLGQTEEAEAKVLLAEIWKKISDRKQKNQRLDHPKFVVPDLFATRGASFTPGNTGGGQ